MVNKKNASKKASNNVQIQNPGGSRPRAQHKNKSNRGRGMGPRPYASGALQLSGPQFSSGFSTYFSTKSTKDGLILSGRDLSAIAISASSATPATVIVTTMLLSVDSAGTPFITRLGTYGNLYQRWRVRRLRATLVAANSTTTVGFNYLGFLEDATSTAPTTVETMMRLPKATMGNAYSEIATDFEFESGDSWLSTHDAGDDRLAFAGALNVATNNYSSALVPGVIVFDYEIEYCNPK
jgi:hypothetical protein